MNDVTFTLKSIDRLFRLLVTMLIATGIVIIAPWVLLWVTANSKGQVWDVWYSLGGAGLSLLLLWWLYSDASNALARVKGLISDRLVDKDAPVMQEVAAGYNPRYVVERLFNCLCNGINGLHTSKGLSLIVRHSNRIGDSTGQQMEIDIDALLSMAPDPGVHRGDAVILGIASRMEEHHAAVFEMTKTLELAKTVNAGADAFMRSGGSSHG